MQDTTYDLNLQWRLPYEITGLKMNRLWAIGESKKVVE